MISPGREWYKYKDDIIRINQNIALSEKFGWTPTEIEALDEDSKNEYLAYLKGEGMAKPKKE